MKRRPEAALRAGNTSTRVGFKSMLTFADLVLAPIERFDELIDDLQQSAGVGLNGCQRAKLPPVFFVSSHAIRQGKTIAKPNTPAWGRRSKGNR
jgi:hypothetical protein